MKKIIFALAAIFTFLIVTDVFAFGGVDSYTTLMLHSDGEHGTTSFEDSSSRNHSSSSPGGIYRYC